MGSPGDFDPSSGEPIRFDRAEYETTSPRAVDCSVCNRPVADVYYESNGQVLCEPCARGVGAGLLGGSGFRRSLKATGFGLAAALGATILIYLFREITGWEAGIISILAGFMVGSAVKQGSDYRGGRGYQVLAVFLTYSALSWSYLPYIAKEGIAHLQKAQAEAAADEEDAAGKPDPKAKGEKAEPVVTAETPAKGGKENDKVGRKTDDAAVVKPAPAARVAEKLRPDMHPVLILVVLAGIAAFLLGIAYCAPILAIVYNMPQGLISLLIVFWGLQQAWQLTHKVSLDIRGPFRVGVRVPSPRGGSADA